MPIRDIVVIGASSGGIEALQQLLRQLPASYAGTLVVVIHTSADYPSVLPEILNRHSPLPVAHAIDGEEPLPGHIYIAPPDHHLLLQERVMRLSRGPKENLVLPRFQGSPSLWVQQAVNSFIMNGTPAEIDIHLVPCQRIIAVKCLLTAPKVRENRFQRQEVKG